MGERYSDLLATTTFVAQMSYSFIYLYSGRRKFGFVGGSVRENPDGRNCALCRSKLKYKMHTDDASIIKQLLMNVKEIRNKEGIYKVSKPNSLEDGEGVAISPSYLHTHFREKGVI